jgi:hypothetical protein
MIGGARFQRAWEREREIIGRIGIKQDRDIVNE